MEHKRILVIGDYVPLVETRAKILERAGYEVRVAGSDDDALRILEHSGFDLIVVGNDYAEKAQRIDQRIKARHPKSIVLKLQHDAAGRSIHANFYAQEAPAEMVQAVRLIFGKVSMAVGEGGE